MHTLNRLEKRIKDSLKMQTLCGTSFHFARVRYHCRETWLRSVSHDTCPSFLVKYPRLLHPESRYLSPLHSQDHSCLFVSTPQKTFDSLSGLPGFQSMIVFFSRFHHLRRDSYSAVSHVRRCELSRSCLPRETQCRPRSALQGFKTRAQLPC